MAHGGACYYRSGFDSVAVLTHDGFFSRTSYHSSLYLVWRRSSSLADLTKPSDIGMAYNFAADMLGLVHGAGKLMGLAPSGDPVFFDARFVGNETDIL
jgi:predicted NodU family carbamoyl transferase